MRVRGRGHGRKRGRGRGDKSVDKRGKMMPESYNVWMVFKIKVYPEYQFMDTAWNNLPYV